MAKKRTRLILTLRENESVTVGKTVITICRSLRNRSTCKIVIEADASDRILRDVHLAGGRLGPAPAPPTNGGNYVDPRGDRDLDAA